MHARERVLALDAADQLGDRWLVGELADDAEQRRLLVRLLAVGVLQQVAHREALLLRGDDVQHRRLRHVIAPSSSMSIVGLIVVARRERPGRRPRSCAGCRRSSRATQHRERLVVDQLRQDLDVRRRFLSCPRRRARRGFSGSRRDRSSRASERLLRFRCSGSPIPRISAISRSAFRSEKKLIQWSLSRSQRA